MREPNIYNPEFIPFYPSVKKKYNLTDTETLLYGFIRFFISTSPGKKFYFSNSQLKEILGLKTETGVSLVINSLVKKCPELKVEYKIKAGGGKVRLITWLKSDFNSGYSQTLTSVKGNNNKINKNNNIFLSKDKNVETTENSKKNFGNEKVNAVLKAFKQHKGYEPTDRRPRQQAWNIARKIETFLKRHPVLIEKYNFDFEKMLEKFFNMLKKKEYWNNIETLDACRRKLNIFFGALEKRLKEIEKAEEVRKKETEERVDKNRLKEIEEMKKALVNKFKVESEKYT